MYLVGGWAGALCPFQEKRSTTDIIQDGKAMVLIRAEDFQSISLFLKFFTDNSPHPSCLPQSGLLPHTFPSGCASSLEEMKEIENHHLANPYQITDSGNTYQWMKLTGEGLTGSCTTEGGGCHHRTPLVSLSNTRSDSRAPWASRDDDTASTWHHLQT